MAAAVLGERRLLALAGLSRAYVLQAQDRILEATVQARQALRLYQALGDPRGEARALYAIGWFLIQLGDHRQAIYFSSLRSQFAANISLLLVPTDSVQPVIIGS